MKTSFQRVIATLNLFQGKQSLTIFLLAAFFALTACGDDGSSSPKGTGLPAEVADMEELETYGCGMDVIGEKVYVTELEENYECDGEKWFKSYDQTKPSSTKSSGSKDTDGGSSSSRVGKSSAKVSSSSSIAVDYNALCGATPYDSTTHFCDIRDSAVYAMVRIGSQTWMAENLNYEYKVEGASFGNCCYVNSPDSCAKYGKLYTWPAAMDSASTGCGYGAECDADTGAVQGVCPNGWHLPSRTEWDTLFAATIVGGQSVAGTALKSETGWYDGSASYVPGTNSSGFSALPSGNRDDNGIFYYAGRYAGFWSSSENGPEGAYTMRLSYGNAEANLRYGNKYDGFSVRCVKD